MNANMERRILLELVYERVRASVNICQLVVLEQELDRSIERASIDSAAVSPDQQGDPQRLARSYMEEAWRRLEKEWQRLREDLDDSFD